MLAKIEPLTAKRTCGLQRLDGEKRSPSFPHRMRNSRNERNPPRRAPLLAGSASYNLLLPLYGYFRRNRGRDDRIANPLTFDNVSRAKKAKKSAKNGVLHVQSFCLAYLTCCFFLLSRFRRRCSCTRLASRVATQTNAKHATISPKKPSIWRKTCATKSTSASTHAEARYP